MAFHTQFRKTLCLGSAIAAVAACPAYAGAPQGGTVVHGGAVISGQGTDVTTVRQSTDRAVIEWKDFSLAREQVARFVQPRSESITLNRVTGGSVSEILGTLEANGRVFLVNRNGVVFGDSARIDVGSLVVSTADIDTRSFLRGTDTFRFDQAGRADASIVNNGLVTARGAGIVAFVAPHVANSGIIQADMGKIALAASNRFTLDLAGDGLISFAPDDGFLGALGGSAVSVDGKVLAAGGKILITANAARDAINGSVRVDGVVSAARAERLADGSIGLTSGNGGSVTVAATGAVAIGADALIDASGTTGGQIALAGTILAAAGAITADGAIGGGTVSVQANNLLSSGSVSARGTTGAGGTVALAAAGRIIATTTSAIAADGATGGTVRVVAGPDAGEGLFSSGAISATGSNGIGGNVLVTGADIKLVAASVDASGKTGGGAIRIGNHVAANGARVIDAASVELSPATTLAADATGNGNGGTIEVWSTDTTHAWGGATARGGVTGGNGGLIEFSSRGAVTFGGTADASAPLGARGRLLLDPKNLTIDDATARFPQYELLDPNPSAGNGFGETVYELSNGNVFISAPGDDFGARDAGAAYLYNQTTGALLGALTGSHEEDSVGSDGIFELENGNFLIRSARWNDGASARVGALTWSSGVTGVSGVVSASNSLVGSNTDDRIGSWGTYILASGDYAVQSVGWNSSRGAVTWGSADSGVVGVVSASNSLVGSNPGDNVGIYGITPLADGYIANSPYWNNNRGAVTWLAGDGSTVGEVSATNSIVGTADNDYVGVQGVRVLPNSAYLIQSAYWNGYRGAVTWVDADGSTVGAVSAGNSLVGSRGGSMVGAGGITILPNGNYVVASYNWAPEGMYGVGAVTWGSGAAGVAGEVSSSNSLIGSSNYSNVGQVTVLRDGNYVVRTQSWGGDYRGSVTWGSAEIGVTGVISASNSLVGEHAYDQIGNNVFAAEDGGYMVVSPYWDNGSISDAGAITWAPAGGLTGTISATNSLVGGSNEDRLGYNGIRTFSDGRFLIVTPYWDNGPFADVGAVTWAPAQGMTGYISASNSLIGSSQNDRIGSNGVNILSDDRLLLVSLYWDNGPLADVGAVTWAPAQGMTGYISASNSLIGSSQNDRIGSNGVRALRNGNFVVVSSNWDNGLVLDVGAVTWTPAEGMTGYVTADNSLTGTLQYDRVGSTYVSELSNGDYIVSSSEWNNGLATRAGAITRGSGTSGITGAVSSSNSLVGGSTDDRVGDGWFSDVGDGNITIISRNWSNGAVERAGAVTWLAGGQTSGVVSASNSLVGSHTDDFQSAYVRRLSNGNYVVLNSSWNDARGSATWGSGNSGVFGEISSANSLVGSTANDRVGSGIQEVGDSNYVTNTTSWHNGDIANAGATTWGSGTSGVTGTVSAANSLVGTHENDRVGYVIRLAKGNFLISSSSWNTYRGAITWSSGSSGVTGEISAANSLVGSDAGDYLGDEGVYTFEDGSYLVASPSWGAGDAQTGAITWSDGTSALVGEISSANSLIGETDDAGLQLTAIDYYRPQTFLAASRNAGQVYVGLLDPALITFARGAGQDMTIASSVLTRVLNTGTDLVLQASNDITVNSAITVDNPAGNGGALTLQAGRSILLNNGITSDNGNVSLIANDLASNGVVSEYRDAGAATIAFGAAGAINAGTGSVLLEMRNGAGVANAQAGEINAGAITAATVRILNTVGTGVTLAGAITASGADDAILIASPRFTNSFGAGALALTGSGRFLVYSNDWENDAHNGLTAGNLYNRSYVSAPPAEVTQVGSQFVYTRQPTLALTADNAGREYGLANPAFTYSATGLVNGDTVAQALTGAPAVTTAATKGASVGTYAIDVSAASDIGYALSFVPGTLTITPALLTVSAGNANREYGLANPAFGGTVTGFRNDDDASVISGLTYTSGATIGSNVGNYAINGSGGSATNYSFAYSPGTLTVTQALLTVSAGNASREYGLANPAFGGTVTGFRNDDDASVISGLTYTSGATIGSNVGSYAINGSGGSATNYSFAYSPGTLTVTQALLTVLANDASREYGLANPPFSGTVSGFRNDDDASVISGLTYASNATADSIVGSYAINGSGASATNYRFSYTPGTLTIVEAPKPPVSETPVLRDVSQGEPVAPPMGMLTALLENVAPSTAPQSCVSGETDTAAVASSPQMCVQ